MISVTKSRVFCTKRPTLYFLLTRIFRFKRQVVLLYFPSFKWAAWHSKGNILCFLCSGFLLFSYAICLILRCNLTHFALPSASFDVVICVISCAEMRHIAMCFDLSCRPISLILFVDFILAKSFPLFSGFP